MIKNIQNSVLDYKLRKRSVKNDTIRIRGNLTEHLNDVFAVVYNNLEEMWINCCFRIKTNHKLYLIIGTKEGDSHVLANA